MSQVRLGELLVRAGILSEEQLTAALREQKRTGATFSEILVDHRMVDEGVLYDALANVSGMPRVTMAQVEVEPAAARHVQRDWAHEHLVAPLSHDRATQVLTVAVSDPTNVGPLDELAFRSGLRVSAHLATRIEIIRILHHQYDGDRLDRGLPAPPPTRSVPPTRSAPPARSTAPAPAPRPPADSGEMVVMHDMSEMRDALHGTSVPPPPGSIPPLPLDALVPIGDDAALPDDDAVIERLAVLLQGTQNASMELQALFELCVAKGLVTRSEYLERLASR